MIGIKTHYYLKEMMSELNIGILGLIYLKKV
jgi:hypothetical protein